VVSVKMPPPLVIVDLMSRSSQYGIKTVVVAPKVVEGRAAFVSALVPPEPTN